MVLEINEKEGSLIKRALETFEEELKTIRGKTDKLELRAEMRDEEEEIRHLLEKVTWH